MNKKWFTLVELIVVIAIMVILSVLSVGSFGRLMQEGDFETSIDRIYNDITSLSVEAVISRAKVSKASFSKSFSGGFFVYKENSVDPYRMELAFLSGSVSNGGKVSLDLIAKNNTVASGTVLNLVAHHPKKEDRSTSVTVGTGSRIFPTDTGFLTFASLADLSEYRFAVVDNGAVVRSGELYFVPNSNKSTSTSILLSGLDGTDFRGTTNAYDSVEISFDLKGRKKMLGFLGGTEHVLKTVKFILLHTGLSNKKMYFEVN